MGFPIEDLSVWIDGVKVPFTSVSYDEKPEADEACLNTAGRYEASCDLHVEPGAMSDLCRLLIPGSRGPSRFDLARRWAYGGRKGRAARRRLLAQGYVAIALIKSINVWWPLRLSELPGLGGVSEVRW